MGCGWHIRNICHNISLHTIGWQWDWLSYPHRICYCFILISTWDIKVGFCFSFVEEQKLKQCIVEKHEVTCWFGESMDVGSAILQEVFSMNSPLLTVTIFFPSLPVLNALLLELELGLGVQCPPAIPGSIHTGWVSYHISGSRNL